MGFQTKVAVVTGGARGIGYRIVNKLASEGANVIILDLDQSKGIPLDAESDPVNKTGASAEKLIRSLKVDVSSKSEIDQAFQLIQRKFGRVDILVNNAGICETIKIMEITENQWDRMLAINLKSVLFCCQAVYPIMVNQKYGKIVNIASIAGKIGGVLSGAHYSVAKAGVIMLTRCLAKELAPYQVNVNAIAPALTDTAMRGLYTEIQVEAIIKGIPLGRMAVPDDLANAVAFLTSDEAAFITGEVLNVNGGSLMD
jgi:NAD(P)-dependent dehydrogenase (short-subunit alcohol dehydrogenase family)